MKVNWPAAASLPPLKSVSSVRHTEPPKPFVCAATGTSVRYAVGAAIVIVCEIVDDETAFATVSDTPYEPCAAYACVGFCADRRRAVAETPLPRGWRAGRAIGERYGAANCR